jgi:hypothetical protein
MNVRNSKGWKIRAAVIGLVFASFFSLGAQELKVSESPAKDEGKLEPSRSIFSLTGGYLSDYGAGAGWALIIRSMIFIGMSPFYYGFGSTMGSFLSTKESVIRHYDLESGRWDFSRSCIVPSAAVQFKTFLMSKHRPWAESLHR